MSPQTAPPPRSPLAGYVIVPLHLLAGYLFSLLPGSAYLKGHDALYGALLVLLAMTALIYGRIVWLQVPRFRTIWLQVLLAAVAAMVPFFVIDFSDPWHAIVYPLILGGSLVACLGVGHVVLFAVRP